jgi:hypothetical protein
MYFSGFSIQVFIGGHDLGQVESNINYREIFMQYEQLAIVPDTIQSWKKDRLEIVQRLDFPKNPSLFSDGIRHLCQSKVDLLCAVSSKVSSG